MSVQIKIIVGPNKGETIRLDDSRTITMGRDPESDLVLPAPNASRNHAIMTWDGERLMVEDLESRNGVYVNASRIEGSFSLGTGDVVELGGCVFSIQAMEGADFSYRRTVNLDEDEEMGGAPGKDPGTSGFTPSPNYNPDTRTIDDEEV